VGKNLEAAKTSGSAAPRSSGGPKSSVKTIGLPVALPPEVKPSTPTQSELEAVKEGTPKSELLAKVGHPSFAVSSPQGGHLVETLSYSVKDGGDAKVRLSDGKVSSVELPKTK
jgi:hypothetical protein